MTTIGIRRNLAVEAPGIDHMVGFDSLDDVLQYADVIAMCVPSTPTTRHLLDAKRISKLQNDAIIINAGRGDAINSQALAEALADGAIRGAGIDVTEPEPLPEESPLWSEPRCLVTPHVAGGNHLSPPSAASSPSHWAMYAATPTGSLSTTSCPSKADGRARGRPV